MTNVQKVPKWDKSHTVYIPLLVHFGELIIIGIPKYGLVCLIIVFFNPNVDGWGIYDSGNFEETQLKMA
jgi:hypothetical protein